MNGKLLGFRNEAVSALLITAIDLEPLNLFFYTWRFWASLANEQTNKHLKSFYFWFSRGSICLIPATYYAVYAGYVVEFGRYKEYLFRNKFEEAKVYQAKEAKLQSTIGYLTLACNLVSCILMALVLILRSDLHTSIEKY